MRTSILITAILTASLTSCSTAPKERAPAPRHDDATFVDSDGDGLPDQRATAAAVFVDSDGDGLPDRRVEAVHAFVDADGDGLPDTRVVR